MASSIDGDAGIGRAAGVDIDVDTRDILENLEPGAMLHAAALHRNGIGLMLDYAFMRLGDDLGGRWAGNRHHCPAGGLEVFVFRRHQRGSHNFDVYGGVRWWGNDLDVDVNTALLPGSTTADIEEDRGDPVFGTRYFRPVDARWTVALQGDPGGFGIGSDFLQPRHRRRLPDQ